MTDLTGLLPHALIADKDLDQLVPLSRTTRWRMRKDGQFPHPVRVRGRALYRTAEIEQWLRNPRGWKGVPDSE